MDPLANRNEGSSLSHAATASNRDHPEALRLEAGLLLLADTDGDAATVRDVLVRLTRCSRPDDPMVLPLRQLELRRRLLAAARHATDTQEPVLDQTLIDEASQMLRECLKSGHSSVLDSHLVDDVAGYARAAGKSVDILSPLRSIAAAQRKMDGPDAATTVLTEMRVLIERQNRGALALSTYADLRQRMVKAMGEDFEWLHSTDGAMVAQLAHRGRFDDAVRACEAFAASAQRAGRTLAAAELRLWSACIRPAARGPLKSALNAYFAAGGSNTQLIGIAESTLAEAS